VEIVMTINASKIVYKPIGVVLGLGAGAMAGFAFKRLWSRLSGEEDAPKPIDEDRGWGEVLAAAALQGIIFSVVRAAVDRAGAEGVRHVTGEWPA
jgi:hypothetical protein